MAKTPKKDDPEQSKRFVEAAKELGSDESGKSFDRAVKNMVSTKRKKESKR